MLVDNDKKAALIEVLDSFNLIISIMVKVGLGGFRLDMVSDI